MRIFPVSRVLRHCAFASASGFLKCCSSVRTSQCASIRRAVGRCGCRVVAGPCGRCGLEGQSAAVGVLLPGRPRSMKSRRDHRVPLAALVMETVNEVRQLAGGCGTLVLPSQGGRSISISRLPKILRSVKVDAVPHGFRSSFRDRAAENTDYPREVVEAGLAHVVGKQTEAAYARSDLFDRRNLTSAGRDRQRPQEAGRPAGRRRERRCQPRGVRASRRRRPPQR